MPSYDISTTDIRNMHMPFIAYDINLISMNECIRNVLLLSITLRVYVYEIICLYC